MKVLIIVLLLALVLALFLLAIVLFRWSRRTYQRYSGLEHQRESAKDSRVLGADRLKVAERSLVQAQRELGIRGAHDEARAVEHQRLRLTTLADQLRHATYGYSPIGSSHPKREAELAALQQRDSDSIADAQTIAELADEVHRSASAGEAPDLTSLSSSLDMLQDSLDRRKVVDG